MWPTSRETEFRQAATRTFATGIPFRGKWGGSYDRHVSAQNRRLVLAQRPSGLVNDSTTRVETEQLPELKDGEALVKVRYLSIDPTIRTWMDDIPSYQPPIGIGEVIRSGGVGEVVDSRSDAYQPGQLVFGMTGWQEYVVADAGERSMQVL